MNYEDKKIVAIIATNVDPKIAMNVIGHLAISIGKYSDNDIMGKKELIDNSGISHLGISKFPFIVTKVKASKLKNAINMARKNPNIIVADYPKEMLEWKYRRSKPNNRKISIMDIGIGYKMEVN